MAIGAIATVALASITGVLAGATYWLGRKTRDMAVETRNLAGATAEELDLLRAQTRTQQGQLDEMHRGRTPILLWQAVSAWLHPIPGWDPAVFPDWGGWDFSIQVTVYNEGGPARLTKLNFQSSNGEEYSSDFPIPSSLSTGDGVNLTRTIEGLAKAPTGAREITILLEFEDLDRAHIYRTTPRIRIGINEERVIASFVDRDERGPAYREVIGRGD